MSAFTVTRSDERGQRIVVLETDDGLEAEVVRHETAHCSRVWDPTVRIEGAHPTHRYVDGRCTNDGCGSVDNGSYGSHFPCGFEFDQSLAAYMDDWRRERGVTR